MPVHIQIRRGSAAEWTAANTILAEGEMGLELDTGYYKFGNGINNWNDLSYSQVSPEIVQDIVGAMVDANTETNITVTYNDSTGKLNFSSTSDVTTSNSQTFTNKSMSGTDNTFTNIPNSALTNSSVTVNSNAVSLGSSITLDTDDIGEGVTNLYFTEQRAKDAVATDIATAISNAALMSTDDLPEGVTNLYYTQERVQDEIDNTIVAGTGLDKTYNDVAGTYTLDIDNTVTTNSGEQISTA